MHPVYRTALRAGYANRNAQVAQDLKAIAVSMFTNKGHADAMRSAETLCRAVPWAQLEASLEEDGDKGTWPLVGLFTEMLLMIEPDMTDQTVQQHVDVFCIDMKVLQPPHMAKPPDDVAMNYFYEGIADHLRTYPCASSLIAPCNSSPSRRPVESREAKRALAPVPTAPAIEALEAKHVAELEARDLELKARMDARETKLREMIDEREAKYAADIQAALNQREAKHAADIKAVRDAALDVHALLDERDKKHAADLKAVRDEAAEKFKSLAIEHSGSGVSINALQAVSEATATAVAAAVRELFQFSAAAKQPAAKKPAARKPAAKKPAAKKRPAEEDSDSDAEDPREARAKRRCAEKK